MKAGALWTSLKVMRRKAYNIDIPHKALEYHLLQRLRRIFRLCEIEREARLLC